MKYNILIISILLLSFLPTIKAQVTIGSQEPPRTGSLLDLNENANTGKNANTQKGLGLPRVSLSSLTTLTIDSESKKGDYVGTMVYNTTTNMNIKEGIYCWMGSTWKQAVIVNNKGNDGSILKSNGDGTYDWSEISLPEYKYYRPTNIGGLKESNAKEFTYSSASLLNNEISSWVYQPVPGTFTNDFVYSDTLNVMTDVQTIKYMLLGTTILTKKATQNNNPPAKTSWEAVQIDVIFTKINDNGTLGTPQTVKSYEKVINTSAGGNANGYIDLFSLIAFSPSVQPSVTLGKGKYQMKIKVSNLRHTFYYNMIEGGNYLQNSSFYKISLQDINFVLYEYE